MGIKNRIRNAVDAFMRPTVSLNDEKLLEWLGITTRDKNLTGEVTYYTCLKMLSETIGKMPLKYFQQTTEGRIRADPDDITRLLTIGPNKIVTPPTWWTAADLN